MTGALFVVRRALMLIRLCVVAALLWSATPAHADITYIYDELGRLRAVIDPSQTDGTAIYSYDAVGNILSITRQPAGQVSIIEFVPKSGAIGSTVKIQGAGFSATPGQNAVTFNGTAATVTTASAHELTVTVPVGATTGSIGVTVSGAGSATSSEPFTVTAASLAPTITGFSPTLGAAGTAVNVTGTNFETLPAANAVTFAGNSLRAPVTSATSTTLATKVPPGAVSGRIKVATPAGSAVSTQDFFVPVGSYTVADVVTTVRMAIGDTQVVSIPTATKIALIIFDGTAGQKVSFRFTGTQISSATVSLYKPDGAMLFAFGMGILNGFIDTKALPITGTYTLVIDPDGSLTGNVTVSLYNVVDVTGSITPGGAAVPITTATPGQNARLIFSGTAGQRVSVRATSITSYTSVAFSLLKPDGTTLTGPISGWAGSTVFLDTVALPAAGTYTVLTDPSGIQAGGATLTLYDITDLTGTISIGGAAVPVTISVPGQNARLTFSGTSGQRVSLLLSNVTLTNNWVSIQKPDGSTLVTVSVGTSGNFVDVQTLPDTGTYTILLDPFTDYTGSVTFTLYGVPADLTGTITAGGAAVPVSTATPGQNATLTFSGTAGQRISQRMSAVTYFRAFVSIKHPDGSTLVAPVTVTGSGNFIDATPLTQTGTHSILVNPDLQFTGAMTLTLYDVPADVTGTLTINDPAVPVSLTTPGQNGSFTFSGTASQQVTVRLTGNTIAPVLITLKKPDGGVLIAQGTSAPSFNLVTQTLPVTGTYTVIVNPDQFSAGSLNLSVTSP